MDVKQMDNWGRNYLRSMMSESDGTGSSSRFCVVMVIVFSLGFVAALLWKIHAPISVGEFCQAVGSLGLFAGGICGTLYGINRVGNVFESRADKSPQQG